MVFRSRQGDDCLDQTRRFKSFDQGRVECLVAAQLDDPQLLHLFLVQGYAIFRVAVTVEGLQQRRDADRLLLVITGQSVGRDQRAARLEDHGAQTLIAQGEGAVVTIIKQEFPLGIGDAAVIAALIVEAADNRIQEDGGMLRLAAGIGSSSVIATAVATPTIVVTTAPASGQHGTGQDAGHSHTQHVFFHFLSPEQIEKTRPIPGRNKSGHTLSYSYDKYQRVSI